MGAGRGSGADGGAGPVRVFVSYAHEPGDGGHGERVRELWLLLRACGIDARLDLAGQEVRRDWAQWMSREVRDADFVLVVASPSYRVRAEGDAGPGEGRGVQWEARLIRERFYADQGAGLREILPVVLPGGSGRDIPWWLAPESATRYVVAGFSVAGAEVLLRALTGQPSEVAPPVGEVPLLPARGAGPASAGAVPGQGVPGPGLVTRVVAEAALGPGGGVVSAVWVAGALAGRQETGLPGQVRAVWSALTLPPEAAAERAAEAGRLLGGVLFGGAGRLVADLLFGLSAGNRVEVVLRAGPGLLDLPVELVCLTTSGGVEVGSSWPAYRFAIRPGDAFTGRPSGARSAGLGGQLAVRGLDRRPQEGLCWT